MRADASGQSRKCVRKQAVSRTAIADLRHVSDMLRDTSTPAGEAGFVPVMFVIRAALYGSRRGGSLVV